MAIEDLAIWNQKISGSFLSDVAHVEIALRNSLDRGLTRRIQNQGANSHWSEDPSGELRALGGSEFISRLDQAKNRLVFQKGEIVPSDLVAELELGFWIAILGKRFSGIHPDLVSCFPGMPDRNIREIPLMARRMRMFRNRIAHHHRILHRDLECDWQNILALGELIHPQLRLVLSVNSETPNLLARFSQTTQAEP